MVKSYEQIQRQIQTLQREAEKLRRDEIAGVVAKIREAVRVYGLTAADLGLATGGRRSSGSAGNRPRRKSAAKKVRPAKYRDDQGNTWGGRGARPQWLRDALAAGRTLEEFAV